MRLHSSGQLRFVAVLLALATLTGCGATSPTAAPRTPATPAPTGPGADVAAMFIDAPSPYERVPDKVGTQLGYLTLDVVIAASPGDKALLVKDGFQFTYAREWAKPRMPISLDISIAEYRDAAAANDVAPQVVADDIKQATAAGPVTPMPASSLPTGATGFASNDTKQNVATYLIAFSKGRYHCNVIINAPINPVTAEDDPATLTAFVQKIAQLQYAKITG